MFSQLSDVNGAMSDELEGFSSTANTSLAHLLQRHQDIFQDYRQEFKKMSVSLLSAVALLGADLAHGQDVALGHTTDAQLITNNL